MLRYKVLVVDDEADHRAVLRGYLEREFAVLEAGTAADALLSAVDSKPDLVLSDVMMPEEDGLSLCRRLRADKRTAQIPVVLMSGARTEDEDQVAGLERGADDYLAKPVSRPLLLAKVRAVLRRRHPPERVTDTLKASGLVLDPEARTARVSGKSVHLTRKEFDLLTTLARRPGRVMSVRYLLETVWGHDPARYNDPHTVGVHVSSLRRKLGPKLAKRLVAVSGLGYRFEA